MPVPSIIKGYADPFYKKSIAEPVNRTSILIKEEMRLEDIASANVQKKSLPVMNNRSEIVKSSKSSTQNQIKFVSSNLNFESEMSSSNFVHTDKGMPEVEAKVVPATINVKPISDTPISERVKDTSINMHAMPTIDKSHKACGVSSCMSCAFNVMYAYFNDNHASIDKTAPRQHINSKFVKSRTVSPPKTRKDIYVAERPKTASPIVTSNKASPPKSKQQVVTAIYRVKQPVVSPVSKLKSPATKTVYRVKCPVLVKEDKINVKNLVLPDKGQFFKHAGPNQVWVRKKV
jgi:hypothetical protein